jgi:glutamate-1-semialdehyde 2,1-aminomutase
MTLDREFAEALAGSRPLADRAARVLAGGACHDSWRMAPFAPGFEWGEGPWKWDVSGRRYVDFWMGHGSLLFGHGFPPVVEAVKRQAERATHLGGAHPLQVAWAERVVDLVPSAERVRFTASGTEATLLALRIARAHTGRERVLRLDGHFHGWHDEALCHFSPAGPSGFNPGTIGTVDLASPFDIDAVDDVLSARDVAALILEPGGGSSASLAWSAGHLEALRRIATRHGTLLVFDEVISGFRYAPGGVQQLAGVLPDLTVLAKILAGGLPGGAVAGPAAIMAVFDAPGTSGVRGRVPHAGTFNANPLSAAAGTATLALVADGDAQAAAGRAAGLLRDGVNAEAERAGVDVRMIVQSSIYHLLIGAVAAQEAPEPGPAALRLPALHADAYARLRRALLIEGVDGHASHGWLSAVHGPAALEQAVDAFGRAFRRLRDTAPFAL